MYQHIYVYVEPLKRTLQGRDAELATVEPPNKGHFGDYKFSCFVLYRDVDNVLSSKVLNV